MKRCVALLLTVVAVFCFTFSLSGCGASDEEKLKSYIESSGGQEIISQLEDSMADNSVFNFETKVEGTALVFDLTLKEQMESTVTDTLSSTLSTYVSSLDSTMQNACDQIEEEIGVEKITIDYNVFNKDGSEIWTHSFG